MVQELKNTVRASSDERRVERDARWNHGSAAVRSAEIELLAFS